MRKHGSSIRSGLACVGMVAMWAAGIALIVFVGKHLDTVFGWTREVAEWTLVGCIFILAPLGLFRRTRAAGGIGFYVASFAFGANLFIFAVIVVLSLWGVLALVIGLLIAGVGVLPVAFLASVWRREWSVFWELVFGLVLTFGARAYGIYLTTKAERQADDSATSRADEIMVEKGPEEANEEDIPF